MANIDIQEKKPSGAMGWILGLVLAAGVIALILFFVFNDDDDDDEIGDGAEVSDTYYEGSEEPMEEDIAAEQAELEEEVLPNNPFPLAAIMNAPGEWNGRYVDGEVTVLEVPTDRGFWVEEDGQRAFFIVDPEGEESEAHIQQGQRLRISSARVHQGTDGVSGQLVPASRQMIQNEPAFFVVDPEDFEIL